MSGYRIAVSYQGLDGVAAAIREVAEAFGGAGQRLASRPLPASSPIAAEIAEALLGAARDALTRAQADADQLGTQVAASRAGYVARETSTAQQFSTGEPTL